MTNEQRSELHTKESVNAWFLEDLAWACRNFFENTFNRVNIDVDSPGAKRYIDGLVKHAVIALSAEMNALIEDAKAAEEAAAEQFAAYAGLMPEEFVEVKLNVVEDSVD